MYIVYCIVDTTGKPTFDTKINLKHGENPNSILPKNKINLSKSLDTFVMIYDNGKNLVASSGTMDGQNPSYPKGVFQNVAKNGEERITWQSQTGLRFASVVSKYDKGFIVAARSLHETEILLTKLDG